MSENPLSPDLPPLLTAVLLSIEGIRRDPNAGEEDWAESRKALDDFDRQQTTLVHRDIAEDVQYAVDDARAALEHRDVEMARRSLIRVGQLFDSWLREHR